MNEEERTPEQTPEEETANEQATAMTRRQFLMGAGAGLVVGAAGAAGVLVVANPAKPAETTAMPAPAAAPPVAMPVAPDLPATMRRVKLNNLGCDRAQCGACTVAIDGRAVNGCTMLAARLGRGQKILTVDGLSKGAQLDQLHPVAKAYHTEGGYQCGICTRGFIMSTYALLQKNPTPNEDDIREALAGNICRCSEYPKIYESVFRAAEDMRKKA